MLFVAFFRWWYGPGWRDFAGRVMTRVSTTYQTFSLPILLRTMFAPWRRIVTYSGGPGLGGLMRKLADNMISRCIGFAVRLCALLAAGALMGGYLIGGSIILILWPFLPFLGPALVVGGLVR